MIKMIFFLFFKKNKMSGEVVIKSSGFGTPKFKVIPYVNNYKLEPVFNYLEYDGLTEENVPDFAKAVFVDRFIPNSLKVAYIEEFLTHYIHNPQFKRENDGKYIVFSFFDDELDFFIINSKDELLGRKDVGKVRDVIPIGPLREIYSAMISCREKKVSVESTKSKVTIPSQKLQRNISFIKSNHYRIKCGMTLSEKYIGNDDPNIRFDVNLHCIFDTGADATFLFLPQYWDFEKHNFVRNSGDPVIDQWHDNVLHVEPILNNVACGGKSHVDTIFFKNPLYVSINGLDPVPIYQMIVPLFPPKNVEEFLLLIGLDVINQYSSIISRFDGKVCLRIMNQKEEF